MGITIIISIAVGATAFLVGLYVGAKTIIDLDDEEYFSDDLHCFECEIEMPVIEKNGRLYCKNCGLRH
jgi:hypothetical protein